MKVRTLTPVNFDGKDIEVGTVIDVSKKAADQMIESRSAEPAGAKAAAEVDPGEEKK